MIMDKLIFCFSLGGLLQSARFSPFSWSSVPQTIFYRAPAIDGWYRSFLIEDKQSRFDCCNPPLPKLRLVILWSCAFPRRIVLTRKFPLFQTSSWLEKRNGTPRFEPSTLSMDRLSWDWSSNQLSHQGSIS